MKRTLFNGEWSQSREMLFDSLAQCAEHEVIPCLREVEAI